MKKIGFFLLLMVIAACGNKDKVNYKEKLTGVWQLANIPEVLKKDYVSGQSVEALKKAQITFKKNGKVNSDLAKVPEDGTWEVSEDGSWLKLKENGSDFDEQLALSFENERTILIQNNGKVFKFKKISD